MIKIIFTIICIFATTLTLADKAPPKPVALFLDCNLGSYYSNAIAPTMKKRGEELLVVKCADFQKTMKDLAKKNVYIKTLFASGHDGDGKIYSDENHEVKGSFNPAVDIAEVNKKYPKLFAHTQSYYPLGCYTTAVSNIQQYNQVLPNLKFISGFYGAAHGGYQKKSQAHLVDVLQKEEQIINAADLKHFTQITSSLKSLNTDLNVGMFRNLACAKGDTKGYALEVDHSDTGTFRRTEMFSKDKCKAMAPQFKKMYEQFLKYDSGKTPVPTDTSTGPVRAMYSFYRQNDYCYKIIKDEPFNYYPSSIQSFSILFHRNYQKNFKLFYKKQMNDLKAKLIQTQKGKWPAATKQLLSRAIAQMSELTDQDLGSWSIAKAKRMAVELENISSVMQNTVNSGLDLCKNQDPCINDQINDFTSDYKRFMSDREAPEDWHSYTGKMPSNPHAVDESAIGNLETTGQIPQDER